MGRAGYCLVFGLAEKRIHLPVATYDLQYGVLQNGSEGTNFSWIELLWITGLSISWFGSLLLNPHWMVIGLDFAGHWPSYSKLAWVFYPNGPLSGF